MPERYVKLGRKALDVTIGHHWAVQVESYDEDGTGDWYEIAGASKKDGDSPNKVHKSKGHTAKSGAGATTAFFFQKEIVGSTSKSDQEIQLYINQWVENNPTYGIFEANCQKFAIQFIAWLTDKNFRLPQGLDGGKFNHDEHHSTDVVVNHGGQAYAAVGVGEVYRNGLGGVLPGRIRGPSAEAEAVAGPGFGAWVNASAGRIETNMGNVVEVHVEPNLRTGFGVRGGNFDAHILGFGGRLGADGYELNTPIGGVRLPFLSAPINAIGNLLRR